VPWTPTSHCLPVIAILNRPVALFASPIHRPRVRLAADHVVEAPGSHHLGSHVASTEDDHLVQEVGVSTKHLHGGGGDGWRCCKVYEKASRSEDEGVDYGQPELTDRREVKVTVGSNGHF
jgi:hypothetical protein